MRGVAGLPPMTAPFALALGRATTEQLIESGVPQPQVLLGRDTRISGPMLASAFAAGAASAGGHVIDVGVVPTPAVSHLLVALGAHAGVVVSASHNPFEDNGLKLFGSDGGKLHDDQERALETRLSQLLGSDAGAARGALVGRIDAQPEAAQAYLEFLLAHAPYLEGWKLGVDCANGAASVLAPKLFQRLGAKLDVMSAAPDGVNINVACGSTHPEALTARVLKQKLDVGVMFDGDADRALLVDKRGRLVTGDHILAITALARGDTHVVATHMTNLGTERFLNDHGVKLERAAVGDRYVLEALRAGGWTLGGEQSGHVLFLDVAPTGDGMLTALQLLRAIVTGGQSLEAWMDAIPVYPQKLVNVRVPDGRKEALMNDRQVLASLHLAEEALGGRGRVLLRPSGTESLLRVMVEAEDDALVNTWTQTVARAVEVAAVQA